VGVALPAGPDSVGPFSSPTTRTRHDVIHRALVPAAESAVGADSAVTDAQGVTGVAHRPGALVATPVHDGRERDDRGGDDEWLGPQSDAVTVVGFDEVDCAPMEHENSLAHGHFVDDGLSVGLGHAYRSGQG